LTSESADNSEHGTLIKTADAEPPNQKQKQKQKLLVKIGTFK